MRCMLFRAQASAPRKVINASAICATELGWITGTSGKVLPKHNHSVEPVDGRQPIWLNIGPKSDVDEAAAQAARSAIIKAKTRRAGFRPAPWQIA